MRLVEKCRPLHQSLLDTLELVFTRGVIIAAGNDGGAPLVHVGDMADELALYVSLAKLDSHAATLSDRIFVFDYLLVSLMIVISILRVNRWVGVRAGFKWLLGLVHIVGMPLMLAAMGVWVYRLTHM